MLYVGCNALGKRKGPNKKRSADGSHLENKSEIVQKSTNWNALILGVVFRATCKRFPNEC